MFGDQDNIISRSQAREIISENYDPNKKPQKNNIQILVSTDILAEGINLHRSNIVINYDLPWNPTKVLQRTGRVNRLGTKHTDIYIFNFFPTAQSDKHLGLEANITAKIQAFHDTLGEDAKYLTDEEEFGSKELFGENIYKKLNTKESYTGEEDEQESELKYLELIRDIRDNNQELFNKIKKLPKKARTAFNNNNIDTKQLLTFFRFDKLKKFFISNDKDTLEINFFDTVKWMKCTPDTKQVKIPSDFYDLLARNKQSFEFATSGQEEEQTSRKGGGSNINYVIKRLKASDIKHYSGFTESDEEFLRNSLYMFEQGQIPKKTAQTIRREMEKKENIAPLKILSILRNNIKYDLENLRQTEHGLVSGKKEVILSGYLIP